MAKLVDALDLGSSAAMCESSSLSGPTIKYNLNGVVFLYEIFQIYDKIIKIKGLIMKKFLLVLIIFIFGLQNFASAQQENNSSSSTQKYCYNANFIPDIKVEKNEIPLKSYLKKRLCWIFL